VNKIKILIRKFNLFSNAVVNYLVEKGVNKNRLSAKGYRQSNPVDSNDTAEGRASNRRTEFEIIEN